MSEPLAYLFDQHGWALLKKVKKGLYGDGTHLTPDTRRDLANMLEAAMMQVIPIDEKGIYVQRDT
jgi:hypothetical protein